MRSVEGEPSSPRSPAGCRRCFCSAIGMNGLGRASSGQASSVRPLTHRQSKRRPLRLEHAEDLDRRVRRFGLEERVAAESRERAIGVGMKEHALGDALELGELAERLVPLGARLEFVGVGRALAGEAGGVEHGGEVPRPVGRRLPASCLGGRKNFLQQPAQERRWLGARDELRRARSWRRRRGAGARRAPRASRARCPRRRERASGSSWLARAKSTGREGELRASVSAASTSGYAASGRPSETLNGKGALACAGRL